MSLPDRSSRDVSQLIDGLTLTWIGNGQIALLTLTDSSRIVIDKWIETISEITETCPYPNFQILNDMENFSATPYFKEKVDNYGSAFAAGKQGRFAVLIENSVLGFIHRLFLQRHLQKTIQGAKLPVEGQAFLSREKAIEWLAEVSVAENQQDKASTA